MHFRNPLNHTTGQANGARLSPRSVRAAIAAALLSTGKVLAGKLSQVGTSQPVVYPRLHANGGRAIEPRERVREWACAAPPLVPQRVGVAADFAILGGVATLGVTTPDSR